MVLRTAIRALAFIEFSIYCPVKEITSANKLKETFQKLSNGKFLGKVWKTLFSKRVFQEKKRKKEKSEERKWKKLRY